VFPVGIGLRDPRSQKRDLGHPSISPFDIAEGTSFVISLPTRLSESAAPRDDKGEGLTLRFAAEGTRFLGGALAGFLFGDFGTFLTGFRQSDGDCLLLAFHGATFSALTGFEGPGFFPMYSALDAFTCCFSVLCHVCPQKLKGDRLCELSSSLIVDALGDFAE
jgi:hypothetical protein